MALVWTQGTTSEACPFALQKRDGSPVSLAGATVTVRYKRVDGGLPSVMTPITGQVAIDDPTNGKFSVAFATADVANAGRYGLQVKVDYGGGLVWYSDTADFIITSTS